MMKKLLLFAVAALMAGSMAAQKPGMAQAMKVSRPHQIVKGQKQAFTKQLVRLGSQENLVQLETPKKVSTTSMRAVKSVTPAQVLAPRKVGELQQSYQGYGSNYQTKETTFWTMYSATAEDGTALLVDVIPVPDGWKEYFDYIPVEYTLNGNQITIDPQKIATGQSDDGTSYYYYIHSWASDDGKIVLTLNDDGSLTTIEDEDIAYSEFTEDNFDLSNDGPYNGLVLDIEKVKYYLEGETPTPNAGYEPEAIFLHPICVVAATTQTCWYLHAPTSPLLTEAIWAMLTSGRCSKLSTIVPREIWILLETPLQVLTRISHSIQRETISHQQSW